VKSLWSGGLFLLAATWVDQHPINRRWLLSALGFALLLLGANLARVAILVLVGQVVGWRLLAEMLHVPLGVIGFMAACLAGLGLLRWVGSSSGHLTDSREISPRPAWLAPALATILLSLVFLYSPRPQPASAAGSQWSFPVELELKEWPLDEVEMAWLTDHGAISMVASRWRFEWQGLRGSMLFISSNTWRAHHRPENCFTVYGLNVQQSQLYLAAPDFPLRWVSMGDSHSDRLFTNAAYWLQSSQRVTDDYSVRIWDDLSPNPVTWVLSTVLFDAPVDPESLELRALLIILRQSIQQGLDTLDP
jgi:exosortase O